MAVDATTRTFIREGVRVVKLSRLTGMKSVSRPAKQRLCTKPLKV